MIVADSGYNIARVVQDVDLEGNEENQMQIENMGISELANKLSEIEDSAQHDTLRSDLVQHLWSIAGDADYP